jgi:MerR family redox-sensitive transcriptional activator SoxR
VSEQTFTIGQVARRVGLRASAIRYYESVGVLPEPARESGQRRYTDETVRRLEVLDVAKRAGFSLTEARVLLATRDGDAPAHEQLRDLARAKLPEVEAVIEQARAMHRWLSAATGCDCETLDICALFDTEAAPPAGRARLRVVQAASPERAKYADPDSARS